MINKLLRASQETFSFQNKIVLNKNNHDNKIKHIGKLSSSQCPSVCLSAGVLFEWLAQTHSSQCLSVCLLVFCLSDYHIHTAVIVCASVRLSVCWCFVWLTTNTQRFPVCLSVGVLHTHLHTYSVDVLSLCWKHIVQSAFIAFLCIL